MTFISSRFPKRQHGAGQNDHWGEGSSAVHQLFTPVAQWSNTVSKTHKHIVSDPDTIQSE